MDRFGSWWRLEDQYDQLSSYLRVRGMDGSMRVRVAAIAASLSLIVASSLGSPYGPSGALAVGAAVTASAVAAAGALLWAMTWPTRHQAIAFALISTTVIAMAALAQSEPAAALLGCTAFAALAIHIAFFYSAPILVYNLVCAAAVAGIGAWRLSASIGVGGALAGFWLVILVNLVAPLGLHITSQVVGRDAFLADRDPLTNLLNRRVFQARAEQMLMKHRAPDHVFVVAVIDLDRFKQLNDRCGHRAGDEALIDVAQAMSDCTGSGAVIGRIGGEEFAIAESWPGHAIGSWADRITEAIAAVDCGVTASIGTATIGGRCESDAFSAGVVVELMSAADAAMYEAKAHGGNDSRHHGAITLTR